MTPKEKAEKLVLKYLRLQEIGSSNWFHIILAKKCALIAVNEILDFMFLSENENSFWINYYNKVKQEIEKL